MKPITLSLAAAAALALAACHSNTGSAPQGGEETGAVDNTVTPTNTSEAATPQPQPEHADANLSPQEKQLTEAVGASFDADRKAEDDPDHIVKEDEAAERTALLRKCFGLIASSGELDPYPNVRQGPATLAQVQLAYPDGHWTWSSDRNAYAFHIAGSDSLTGQPLKDDMEFETHDEARAGCPNGVAFITRVAINNLPADKQSSRALWEAMERAAEAKQP